jgi:hypothetical protein
MEYLDRVLHDDPALANTMRGLSAVLDARHAQPLVRGRKGIIYAVQPDLRSAEHIGFELQSDAVEEVVADNTPPAGIYGLGVTISESRPMPTILVVESLIGGASSMKPISVWDLPAARVVTHYLRMSGFEKRGPAHDLKVIGIPPPDQQAFTIGCAMKCGIVTGRSGVEVQYQGNRGVFTAGHVGWPVNAKVRADDDPVGAVVYADRLSNHLPGELVADVAIVRLDRGVEVRRPQTWPSQATVIMGAGEDNAAVVAAGGEGEINTLMQDFSLRQDWGKWANVYFVTAGISQPGDSGEPVYLKSIPQATIGHVVGGTTDYYTLVQDMKFLLEATGATLM